MRKWAQKQIGFTIVELLIVVVVIAILATIVIVAYTGIQNQAKISVAKSTVNQAVKKVQLYATTNSDTYPINASEAGLSNSDDVMYEVSSNNETSPKSFCVTATTNGLTYFQTNVMVSPVPGTCIGMLAWWPFNGDAQDYSGHEIHGIVQGAVLTNGMNGTANSAYQLGETSQYINVGTPPSFSVLSNSLSYSIWLARTTVATGQWPQIMGASDTHRDFGIRTSGYGASPYFEYGLTPYDGSSFTTGGGISNGLATNNEWHHILVTYDGNSIRTYWDGQLKSTAGSSVVLRPTVANFSFTRPAGGWPGKIDDARVYNRALSGDEVTAMYQAGAQ